MPEREDNLLIVPPISAREIAEIFAAALSRKVERQNTLRGLRTQISALKGYLKTTNYVTLKLVEADSQEEIDELKDTYSDVIQKRKDAREEIKDLELEVQELQEEAK